MAVCALKSCGTELLTYRVCASSSDFVSELNWIIEHPVGVWRIRQLFDVGKNIIHLVSEVSWVKTAQTFQSGWLLSLLIDWMPWLELPLQCWIGVARTYILVLFLISGGVQGHIICCSFFLNHFSPPGLCGTSSFIPFRYQLKYSYSERTHTFLKQLPISVQTPITVYSILFYKFHCIYLYLKVLYLICPITFPHSIAGILDQWELIPSLTCSMSLMLITLSDTW